MTELEKVFKGAIYKTVDFRGRPATVGRQDGTAKVTAENGTVYKDRIWITYTDTGTKLSEAIVRRVKVPFLPGMPVLIKDIKGIPTAYIDEGPVMDVYSNNGNSIPVESHQHYLEGPNPEYVEGLRFMPVGVHPSEPPALTVYVEPGFYRYEGVIDAWTGGDSGSLATYVPVVDDARIHFVIIALDRSDNSIDIIDGDDVLAVVDPYFTIPAFVDYDDILAIDIDAKYMPLAVVELTYGQTAVKVKHITYDHRLWGGEAGIDINGLTEDTAPDPEADYFITYDTSAGVNKKVLPINLTAGAGNISLLFSQTADKTVANTTTPTDLFSTTGQGSVTIPANTFENGTIARLTMGGYVGTTGTPTLEMSVELGGVEIGTTDAHTLGADMANIGWRLNLEIVCRVFPSPGSFVITGLLRIGDTLAGVVNTSFTSLDPTDPLQLEVLGIWGTADAGNSITCQTAVLELLSVAGI